MILSKGSSPLTNLIMQERVELVRYKGMWNVALGKVKQEETLMSVSTEIYTYRQKFPKKKNQKYREMAHLIVLYTYRCVVSVNT